MEDAELTIPSPLLECLEHCEVNCERGCCGIDAFSADIADIALWAHSAGPSAAAQALHQLDTLIAAARQGSHLAICTLLHYAVADDDDRAVLIDFLTRFRNGLSTAVNRPDALTSIEPLLRSFAYALTHLRLQVRDVPDERMAAQPPCAAVDPGSGVPTNIPNHPAWTIGHLVFTCQLLAGVAGVPSWLPDHWESRYGPGSKPTADLAAYESKSDLLAALTDAESRLTQAVRAFECARLDDPFPDPAYRVIFPTVRHAFTQVLAGHTAYHVGQLSVWRRAMGMWPLNQPFE